MIKKLYLRHLQKKVARQLYKSIAPLWEESIISLGDSTSRYDTISGDGSGPSYGKSNKIAREECLEGLKKFLVRIMPSDIATVKKYPVEDAAPVVWKVLSRPKNHLEYKWFQLIKTEAEGSFVDSSGAQTVTWVDFYSNYKAPRFDPSLKESDEEAEKYIRAIDKSGILKK